MTPGEKLVWAAVYAAHVHSPSLPAYGHATYQMMAQAAAKQASIAVAALHVYADADRPDDFAAEQAREVLQAFERDGDGAGL